MENKKVTENKKEAAMTREDFAVLWKTIHLKITDCLLYTSHLSNKLVTK